MVVLKIWEGSLKQMSRSQGARNSLDSWKRRGTGTKQIKEFFSSSWPSAHHKAHETAYFTGEVQGI